MAKVQSTNKRQSREQSALLSPLGLRPTLQRGDAAAALPLYERALGIWEAALGPDHPDVAHTLTDIAVIHLEQVGRGFVTSSTAIAGWLCGLPKKPFTLQGRDDLGRPLLERALAIQERHLGPNHPDVVAIRDVLAEEV